MDIVYGRQINSIQILLLILFSPSLSWEDRDSGKIIVDGRIYFLIS